MNADEIKGATAIVVALVTVIGGVITSRRTEKHEKERVETGPIPVQKSTVPPEVPASLTDRLDSDGVGEFMRILVSQYSTALERLTRLEGEVETLKKSESTFRGALGRWLTRVYTAWGHQAAMPMPENPEDLVTLKDVLPR